MRHATSFSTLSSLLVPSQLSRGDGVQFLFPVVVVFLDTTTSLTLLLSQSLFALQRFLHRTIIPVEVVVHTQLLLGRLGQCL